MSNKVILLVEDNPDDEALALRAFRKSNVSHQIVVARDGVEALDYLFAMGQYTGRNTALMPDIVLLDLQLPRLDGLEVLRLLRADKRTEIVPIVVLTSSNEAQDVYTCYKLCANSYIRKPVDFNEFADVIRQLSKYWLTLNEVPPARRSI